MPKRLLGQFRPIHPLKRPLQLRAHAPLVATPMPNNPPALSTEPQRREPPNGIPSTSASCAVLERSEPIEKFQRSFVTQPSGCPARPFSRSSILFPKPQRG